MVCLLISNVIIVIPGDTIVSINGHIVTAMSHGELIKLISSYRQMRMIVIFENIRQRIELVARAIKLQKILNDKLYQLNLIDIEEQTILNSWFFNFDLLYLAT